MWYGTRGLSGTFELGIVASSEKICARDPAMMAVGEYRDCPLEVYKGVEVNGLAAIQKHFLPAAENEGIEL